MRAWSGKVVNENGINIFRWVGPKRIVEKDYRLEGLSNRPAVNEVSEGTLEDFVEMQGLSGGVDYMPDEIEDLQAVNDLRDYQRWQTRNG